MSDGRELVRYDAMCHAIAAAYEVDEVKDIRDKALALETYARLAQNVEAERQACEIRLRAERKAGQLLRARDKAKGGQPYQSGHMIGSGPVPLAELGISRNQSSQWQRLARVPDDEFERHLAADRPTTNGIVSAHAPEPAPDAVDPRALWLWGRLRDFERDGLLDVDPAELIGTMLTHMKETTKQLAPLVAAWLERIK